MNDSTAVFLFKVTAWLAAMAYSIYWTVVVYSWLITRMMQS